MELNTTTESLVNRSPQVKRGHYLTQTGSLKAWGFAGASMMLSANLRVGPTKNNNDDLGIDTKLDVERRFSRAEPGLHPNAPHDNALGGHFNLFAGVQAGIKINGALHWPPPPSPACSTASTAATPPAIRARTPTAWAWR
ncbi:MAG: xlyA [Pseudomonas sp.]|nr:xlyA [Pseudomonas sp.]